jgi:hypothetical protein
MGFFSTTQNGDKIDGVARSFGQQNHPLHSGQGMSIASKAAMVSVSWRGEGHPWLGDSGYGAKKPGRTCTSHVHIHINK